MANNPAAPYNFRTRTGQSALAARIASLKTTAIQELFRQVFGTVVNIMQKFPNPPKCEAACYIVDNAPQSMLQQVIAANLQRWEKEVEDSDGRGRPVNRYRHDADHNNRNSASKYTPDSDDKKIQIDDIAQLQRIVDDANKPQPAFSNNLPKQVAQEVRALPAQLNTLDEKRVREIAVEEDKKLARAIEVAVSKALTEIAKPTIVHVSYKDKDGSVALRDMGTQHREFPMLMQLIEAGFPVWIPGPAGSGKTTAVTNACKALNATLHMPPEGPIENKYGMIGYMDAMGKFVETSLYHACVEARDNPQKKVVYFIDECDAAYANALMVLNAVMENGYCTFANSERVHFGDNLQFIAGANTFGNGATHDYVGRNKLDGATLDRFITLAWDYDEALELAIVQARYAGQDAWVKKVQRIRKVARDIGKHIVSPRASIRGAKLLSMGMDEAAVLRMTVYKSMTSDTVATITSRI